MTIDEIKKAIREIEIAYDYNYRKNDYDIVLNLTELANLIKTLQGKAIDDFAERIIEELSHTTLLKDEYYLSNIIKPLAEQLKAGGENK